ncbi:MAG: hypothetical protein RSA29_14620 [Clostridium sp.]|uniref:hypothetical protein n=1 Tax=Clostridium sp. TaxID=1506 RepID=UPI003217B686
MFKYININTENLIIKPYCIDDIDDLNYSGYDGELYYSMTQDEYNGVNLLK